MTAHTHAAPLRGARRFVRRHPLATYLVLVFGLGYPVMAFSVLVARGVIPGRGALDALGLDGEIVASAALVWLALLPAAIVSKWLEGGQSAVADWFAQVRRWRVGARWWAVIVVALPGLTVLIALLLGDRFRVPTLGAIGLELLKGIGACLVFNLFEEASWSGIMQARLVPRHGTFRAAVFTALPFAAVHLPLEFLHTTPPLGQIAGRFLVLLVLSIVARSYWGQVLRGTGGSLLLVGVAHTVFNRSNNSTGIVALLVDGDHRGASALLATAFLGVALTIHAHSPRARRGTRQEAP